MKCYHHHQADAVGICRFCARGLCPECAVEVEGALACSGSCEQQVRHVVGSLAHGRAQVRLGSALTIVMGLVFLTWGLLGGGAFLVAAGAVLLTMGAAWAVLNWRRL